MPKPQGNLTEADWNFDFHSLSYDKSNDKYYITSHNGSLLEIDIKTNTAKFYKYHAHIEFGIDPESIFIDGKLSIICGHDSNRHLIFDPETAIWTTHHIFKELKTGNSAPGLIHIPSQNIVYVMGGYNPDDR